MIKKQTFAYVAFALSVAMAVLDASYDNIAFIIIASISSFIGTILLCFAIEDYDKLLKRVSQLEDELKEKNDVIEAVRNLIEERRNNSNGNV